MAGTLLSVSLTGTKGNDAQPAKPQSTNILAPGAQVDPRDAWRGQADAQLKAIEQRSRDLAQRNAELEGQGKEMLERLKKLEGSGLTPLPPPPVAAPAARPSFGPDRPGERAAGLRSAALPAATAPCRKAPCRAPACHRRPAAFQSMPTPTGIVSIVLADVAAGKGAKPAADAAADQLRPVATRAAICPAAPSPGRSFSAAWMHPPAARRSAIPQPVLLRLADNAILPNQFRARVKECFIVGAGYGDVSSERAYIRTESLSCVTRDGTAIDVPVKGYVAGEDGKAGMRGRLVSKQGQILANALLAGVASGIGHAFTQSSTTLSVSPLGTTSTVDPGKQLEAGSGHRRRQGPGPARPVLHQPRREGLPGDRSRRGPQRRRGPHAGRRPARDAGRRRHRSRQPRATRRARPHPPEERR